MNEKLAHNIKQQGLTSWWTVITSSWSACWRRTHLQNQQQ